MRGLGIGIAVFFGWTTNGFLALFFPALVEAIHINGVLFRFPGCLGGAAQCAGPSLPGRGCLAAMRDGAWATPGPASPTTRDTAADTGDVGQKWVRSRIAGCRIAGYCRRGSRSW
jgi:hypothetical protein